MEGAVTATGEPDASVPASGASRIGRRVLPTAWRHAFPLLLGFLTLAPIAVAGGGYLPRPWRVTALAFALLACAVLISSRPVALARTELWFVGLLAAFAGWTTLSSIWSDQPATSRLQGERAAMYALVVGALLLAAERATIRLLCVGAVAATTVVSAYGLVRYLIEPRVYNPIEEYLLFQPLGYANAFGIFAAIGLLLTLGLASVSRGVTAALALAPVAVLAPTLYLTSSRGAALAFVAGLLVLGASGLQAGARRVALVAVAVLVVGAVALASRDAGLAGHLFGENRPHYWHVAWREYQSAPVLGTGSGTFSNYWLHLRGDPSFSRYAHSLYVESLAELGPLGLGLLLACLAVPLTTLRREGDPLRATAAAGYVAFLVHAGVDWDWQVPATTISGLFCAVLLLAGGRSPETPPLGRGLRLALALTAAPIAGLALLRLHTGPSLPFAG
jgi:O-antigen ligase